MFIKKTNISGASIWCVGNTHLFCVWYVQHFAFDLFNTVHQGGLGSVGVRFSKTV